MIMARYREAGESGHVEKKYVATLHSNVSVYRVIQNTFTNFGGGFLTPRQGGENSIHTRLLLNQ